MKIKFIILLIFSMASTICNASFKLDSSLNQTQKETFEFDIRSLKSFAPSTSPTKVKLLLGHFDLSGIGLYSLLTNNLIAVVGENFKPTICLHEGTSVSSLPGTTAFETAKKLLEQFNAGHIPACAPSIVDRDYLKATNLKISNNQLNASYLINGLQFFDDIGIKGGLFFSDGLFLPQNFPEQNILVLNSNLSKFYNPLPIGNKEIGEVALSYIRLADYFSEVLGEGEPDRCVLAGGVPFICDQNEKGKFVILGGLLSFFSDNCQQCQESDKTFMRFLAAESLSHVKGFPIKSIEMNRIIENNKSEFMKQDLDYYRILTAHRKVKSL